MSDVAICAVMKYEAPYILEWVAYYDLLGFRLIVADNGGNDETSEILARLQAAGVIDRIDYRWRSHTPQIPSYRCLTRAANRLGCRIIGFLDTDEFFTRHFPLIPLAPENGADYIRALFDERDASQISFHWTCYGSRTASEDLDRPVLERFEHHGDESVPWNQWTKSFVRADELLRARDILQVGPRISSAHSFVARRNWFIDDKPASEHWKAPEITYNLGRVLHYQNKSWPEYQRKIAKGDVAYKKNKNDRGYFDTHDYDTVRTPVDPAVIAQVEARMAELRDLIAAQDISGDPARFSGLQSRLMSRGVSSVWVRKKLNRLRQRIRGAA